MIKTIKQNLVNGDVEIEFLAYHAKTLYILFIIVIIPIS